MHTGDAPKPSQEEEKTRYTFPCKSGKTYTLPLKLYRKLETTFPNIDLHTELNKASLWCETNASNQKTINGMPKFLSGWMGRAKQSKSADDDLMTPEEAMALLKACE